MDKIIHCLDYGEFETTLGGVRDYVFFIVFEMARGDVRQQASRERRQGLSWTTNALHNLAVAIQQLHTARIAHNDIKPSNLLVFDDYLQKLADLGRATSDVHMGPWDGLIYAGDSGYAAPEFLYRGIKFPHVSGKVGFQVREASDIYLLGSMGYFFVAGNALSPMILQNIRPEHAPANWNGTYNDVIPYIRDGLGLAMEVFDAELPRDATGALIKEGARLRAIILELCDPDPSHRGHPANRIGHRNQYSVEQYISIFRALSDSLRLYERSQR